MKQKIYVAGCSGMIGSALAVELKRAGYDDLLLPTRKELDLMNPYMVDQFIREHRPDCVIFAAGKTGGLYSNQASGADYIYENLQMQNNIIYSSFINEVKKFIFISCSSVYPKFAVQPYEENCIMSGMLEPTNEMFGIAKIAGMKMCQAYNMQYGTEYLSVIPTNTYGPNQNYDEFHSQVIPAMIARFHYAKENGLRQVILGGTGTARRDFLFSHDLAKAIIHLWNSDFEGDFINVGTGNEIQICELAKLVQEIIGYKGTVVFDNKRGDGVLSKSLDLTNILQLGWKYETSIEKGIEHTYKAYLASIG